MFESIYIPTASMEPTLRVGTHCFLDKVTYRLREPRRGEIVVFRSPVDPKEELAKRLIALPGDTVELRDKRVLLGGVEQAEPYVRYTRAGERLQGDNVPSRTLRAGCYFVLGDNRDESNDSSIWKDKDGDPAPCLLRRHIRGIVRGFF